MLTTDLAYYRDVNIRGVVNDTTVPAQKRDVCVISILVIDSIDPAGYIPDHVR